MKNNLPRITIALMTGLFLMAAQAQTDTVRMENNVFIPEVLEIESGTTVVWINDDAFLHTSTSGADCTPDGVWASGDMDLNDVFSFTFDAAGTFPYYCVYHCSIGMTGTIVVSSVGIDETPSSLTVINLGPVPSGGNVYLEMELKERATVSIALFDLKGMEVMKVKDNAPLLAGEHRFEIAGKELDPGTYVCRILSNEEVVTRKIVIQ